MTLDATKLAAVTGHFSSTVYRELAKKGRSGRFARLHKAAQLNIYQRSQPTVADAFESAFAVLKAKGLRDEYIYRAALTHKILLGTHSLRTACVLNEFRAGTSKADVVILNGTATAYEIKSERDSIARLSSQLENYRKVFAKTYVIVGETHLGSVIRDIPKEVGVMRLSQRGQISTEREASDRPDRIDPLTVFGSIRSTEAQAVLRELGVAIPNVPNTKLYAVMRQLFEKLEPVDVHRSMVKILKRTRSLAPLGLLIDRLPKSLHPVALSAQIRRSDHDRLVDAVNTPLASAMYWA